MDHATSSSQTPNCRCAVCEPTSCSRSAPSGCRTCRKLPSAGAAFPVCQPGQCAEQAGRAGPDWSAVHLPAHVGKNFDALYDSMTDPVHKSGPQPGFVAVLEHIPANAKFDKEAREQLLDIFRDAADYWGTERYRSDVSILFCSPFCTHQPSRTGERGSRHQGHAHPSIQSDHRVRREDADRQIVGRVAAGAAHEQPLQRGVLAAGLTRRQARPCCRPQPLKPVRRAFSFTWGRFLNACASAMYSSHRHFLGAALYIEAAGKPWLLQPAAQRVAQQFAPLAEGHLHHSLSSCTSTAGGPRRSAPCAPPHCRPAAVDQNSPAAQTARSPWHNATAASHSGARSRGGRACHHAVDHLLLQHEVLVLTTCTWSSR
jgi:hypothetical protein